MDTGAMRPPAEQTILVTGATDGLGRALAVELAGMGATLLLHGRDDSKGQETIEDVRARTRNEKLEWYKADLASLAEVCELAARVDAEHDRLDVLVNNAGIGTNLPGDGRRMESRDGYELRFAVNYLASFLLTRQLQPLLVRSAPARIVNVSSAGQAPLDFDDVMLERAYDGVQAYCQSKLAQVMFTFDLAGELSESGVTVNCLHPATFMPTKMVRAAGVSPTSTIEEGVQAVLRLVADPELDGVTGRYFNGQREATAHPQAYDAEAVGRLRELSERLVDPSGKPGAVSS
jgi:NAD(P)-dependent dehydrogenase (short-subunit alcohol dehydrogenase family)